MFYFTNWVELFLLTNYSTFILKIKGCLMTYSVGWFAQSRTCFQQTFWTAGLAQTSQKGCAHTIYLAADAVTYASSTCVWTFHTLLLPNLMLPLIIIWLELLWRNGVHWCKKYHISCLTKSLLLAAFIWAIVLWFVSSQSYDSCLALQAIFSFKAVFHLHDVGYDSALLLMWMAQSLKCFKIVSEYCQIYCLCS